MTRVESNGVPVATFSESSVSIPRRLYKLGPNGEKLYQAVRWGDDSKGEPECSWTTNRDEAFVYRSIVGPFREHPGPDEFRGIKELWWERA